MPGYNCTVEFNGPPWKSSLIRLDTVAEALSTLMRALDSYENVSGLSVLDTESGCSHLMAYEPERNMVTLYHRSHPAWGEIDLLFSYHRNRNDLEKLAEETLGKWQGDYWYEHTDEAARRRERERLWEVFRSEYRTQMRNWAAVIRKRDHQSLRAMRRMAVGVRRAMPGVSTEIVGANNGVIHEGGLTYKILTAKDADELAGLFVSNITDFCRRANGWR